MTHFILRGRNSTYLQLEAEVDLKKKKSKKEDCNEKALSQVIKAKSNLDRITEFRYLFPFQRN